MFRAKPKVFERLLVERAGIGEGDLKELREVHTRAGTYLRSVSARTAAAARHSVQSGEAIAETIAVDAPVYTPEPPVDEHARIQPNEPATPDRRPRRRTNVGDSCTTDSSATGTTLSPSPTGPDCRSPPGARVRRTDRPRAGPRRTSATPLDGAPGVDGAARLPPHGDGRPREPFTTTSRRRNVM